MQGQYDCYVILPVYRALRSAALASAADHLVLALSTDFFASTLYCNILKCLRNGQYTSEEVC